VGEGEHVAAGQLPAGGVEVAAQDPGGVGARREVRGRRGAPEPAQLRHAPAALPARRAELLPELVPPAPVPWTGTHFKRGKGRKLETAPRRFYRPYPGVYSFYDWEQDADDLGELLDPGEWGRRYFAVDRACELAGFFVFTLRDGIAEVGLGLRPDLTGRGLGVGFLAAGLRFAAEALGAEGYTLAVAAFNGRALTVYERAGFVETDRYQHRTNGGLHDFVRMTRGR
jgi:[ribosomal protein S18]-alanine N-acetyltransferase